ncbi:MAG: MBL fold metallo-hydrolase [Nevskia sp.]|nr:MBL fold metallo-hydrolase [Nevskia sp.]
MKGRPMPRYRNRYPYPPRAGFSALRFLRELRRQARVPVAFPRGRHDAAWLAANRRETSLTWIGHASFLLQHGGLNLLTDPHLSGRASPFSFAGPARLAPPGLEFHELPPIDAVLISHNHYDHLDALTVRRLAREHPGLRFFVPLGLADWFRRRGIERVTELDWWQSAELGAGAGAARVTAVPVQHFSGRGLRDRNATLWCGMVFEHAGAKVFFAGDTGYSRDFADIAARFAPFDLALIPIGAYEPRGFMAPVHVNPEEAVRIHQELGSRLSVAMHWGTFRLTLEPMDEPPRRLAAALAAAGIPPERFIVMRHGECRRLDFSDARAAPPTARAACA